MAGDAVGGLEGFLEAEAAVADLDGEASTAEFAGKGEGGGVAFGAEGGDVGVEFGRFKVRGSRFEGLRGGLGLEGEDEAVFADGEADAGGARAAEHLGEAVVAAAAEESVLGAEAGGWIAGRGDGELEGGAGVVVEAADEAGIDGVRHTTRVERGADLGEVVA